MEYQLLLQYQENNQQKTYPISSKNTTRIGRDPAQCDLIIDPNDLGISRLHIQISFDQQTNIFLLKNISNKNPVTIDQQNFTYGQTIPLTQNTAIILGKTMVKVVDIMPIVPPTVINYPQNNNQVTVKYYENNMLKQSILGKSIALGRDLPTIQKRVPKNNNITPLEINHDHISSYHALIEAENGQLFITDQKSSNGTFINGNDKPQTAYNKAILKNGDNLKLGHMDVEGKVTITQNEMMIEIHNNQNQQTPIQTPIQTPQPPKQITIKLKDSQGQKLSSSLNPPIALGKNLLILQQKVGKNNILPIEINHDSISGYHALIDIENGELVITDQGSTNGTFINDTQQNPHTKVILRNGDKLKLGIVEGTITINQNEIIVDMSDQKIKKFGLYCAKCSRFYENKTVNDFCEKGHFLADANSGVFYG